MRHILLVHVGLTSHYRVANHGYLSRYLKGYRFNLIVTSDCIPAGSPDPVGFAFSPMRFSAPSIVDAFHSAVPSVTEDGVNGFIVPPGGIAGFGRENAINIA